MGIPAFVHSFFSQGYKTANAGTIIQVNVQGKNGLRTALMELLYTAAATAHTLSILFANATSKTTASAAAAAGQAHLLTTDAPKDPAGNAAASGDVIAYQLADGTWEFNTVSSISSSDITLGTNIAVAVPAGAKVRIFGVVADGSCFQFPAGANASVEYGKGALCFVHPDLGEPCVLQSNNATNAGFLLNALFAFINK